jgi:hypothetical protein
MISIIFIFLRGQFLISKKSHVSLGANVTKINCDVMNILGLLGCIKMYKCTMWVYIMSVIIYNVAYI